MGISRWLPLGLLGVCVVLARPQVARAQYYPSVTPNIFFGASSADCANGLTLFHVRNHKDDFMGGTKLYPYACLETGDTERVFAVATNADCRYDENGKPAPDKIETIAVKAFGKTCIWVLKTTIAYDQAYRPGAPPSSGGGSTGSTTSPGGTAITPNSPSGGINPQDTSGGKAQPNVKTETKVNKSSLGQGSCPAGSIETSQPLEDGGSNCVSGSESGDQNPIYRYLRKIIQFLSAGVGIVIVLLIVIGGVQYITSTGNPQSTAAAKGRITSAIMALLLFIFMFAILNFLVPGGLLS